MSRKYRKTVFREISLALIILFALSWCIPGGLHTKIVYAEEQKPLVWNTVETVVTEEPPGVVADHTKIIQSGKDATPLEGSLSIFSVIEQQKRIEKRQDDQLNLLKAFMESQKKQQEVLFLMIGNQEKKNVAPKSDEKPIVTTVTPAAAPTSAVTPAAPGTPATTVVPTPAAPVTTVEPMPATPAAQVTPTAVEAAPVAPIKAVDPAPAAPAPAVKKKAKKKRDSEAVKLPEKVPTQPEESASITTVNVAPQEPPKQVVNTVATDTVAVDQGQPVAVVTETPAGVTPPPTVIVKTVYIERPAPQIQDQDVRRTAGDYITENTQGIDDAYIKEAEVSFFYSSGGLYRFNTKEGFLTDIKLQPGEKILSVMGGDTVRWIVEQAVSGSGAEQQSHVYIKPLKSGLETNIIINTDRHSYQLVVQSTSQKAVPMVSWTYPQETRAAFIRQQSEDKKRNDQSVTMATSVENLNFSYSIDRGNNYSWAPEKVFDDGRKVYIIMPENVQEAPVLFVREGKNRLAMVAYRIKGSYYIVDRLFSEAEMRNGTDQIVRIKRKNN